MAERGYVEHISSQPEKEHPMALLRKHIEYVKTIESLTRLRVSRNGNARFLVRFTDGTEAKTQRDSSVAINIENRENIGVPVLVKATPGGEIWGISPAEPEAHTTEEINQ